MSIAAVLFDFFGTLTPGRTPQAQVAARAVQARALGVEVAAYDAVLTATYPVRFRGETGDVVQTLAWVARQLGARPSESELAAAAEIRLATERRFGIPRPEAAPLLRDLRERGLRIGVISDCSAELPTYFPELPIAPLVDAAVFSWQTGRLKPDSNNYETCCDRLGVHPSECWYVGDGGSNELHGARALGMHAVHLDVAVERGDVVYGRHAAWDGDRIQSLPDLLPLVDSQRRER